MAQILEESIVSLRYGVGGKHRIVFMRTFGSTTHIVEVWKEVFYEPLHIGILQVTASRSRQMVRIPVLCIVASICQTNLDRDIPQVMLVHHMLCLILATSISTPSKVP